MIISRTPFRVSFFGGGTDYLAWYREHGGGAVVATTIDKYCYISVRELPPFFEHRFRIVYSIVEDVMEIDEIRHPAVRAVLQRLGVAKGLEIHHDGDLPARSGLGSSSAFTVGLISAIHALEGRYSSKDALASEAIHIEQRVLREAVGVQDQISTAFGGPGDDFSLEGSGHVVSALMARMHAARLTGEPTVTIWGSGAPRREFLYVDDLADAVLFLMQGYEDGEPINIGTGVTTSIRELSEIEREVVGFKGDLVFDAGRPDGAPLKGLDSAPLQALGWAPSWGLRASLESTYEWFLRHAAGRA